MHPFSCVQLLGCTSRRGSIVAPQLGFFLHRHSLPRNSEGAFLLTKEGKIRFIYTRYRGTDWNDHAAADLAEVISEDGGATWKDRGVVVSRGDAANIMSVSLLRLQDGSIRLFYCEKRTVNGGCMSSPMSMKRDPKTGFLYAVWNGTNRILYPLVPTTTDRTPLVLVRSRDNGVTWEKDRAVLLEREPDHGYCYTAMLFHGNNMLLAYCCGLHVNGSGQLRDLRIRKITLASKENSI